jgi:hypothetical protein
MNEKEATPGDIIEVGTDTWCFLTANKPISETKTCTFRKAWSNP